MPPDRKGYDTYETDQPWVVYTFLTTPEAEARNRGLVPVHMQCAICGGWVNAELQLPPPGRPAPLPVGGVHPMREAFLAVHAHPGAVRREPRLWEKPQLNPTARDDRWDLVRSLEARALAAADALANATQEGAHHV